MPDEKDAAQTALHASGLQVGQKYKHFKGGEYEIMALAIKEDTLEPLIIYRSLTKEYVWARTLENFTENVDRDGKTHKRFTLIE